ncbi:MAG: hypothetical protein SGJ18_03390 [Pseudomonadota bacterium]|nr:hypothetical protein [Pseudomonadota bacterium]
MKKDMKKNLCLFYLLMTLISPISSAATEDAEDIDADLLVQPELLILKDEDPLRVNPNLSAPEKIVNLRAVQKEVLSIALPEESPEETEERAPVEE